MKIDFDKYPQVVAGLSERSDGSMVWWNRTPVEPSIRQNRDNYFEKVGINPRATIAGGIAHGINVAAVGASEAGEYLTDTDGLITSAPGIFLTVTAADCLPIFCYDPAHEAVGMFHASWRCLIAGILENALQTMKDNFSSRPEDLIFVIGPHIGVCHYEVGEEVADRFSPSRVVNRDGKLFVDLGGEAEDRLRFSGVKNITVSQECTYDNPEKFYSARRDKDDPIKGMVAYIGIKS
jgi:polyphenol oxidase